MPFSVPFVLEKSLAVWYRLDQTSIDTLQAYSGETSGYDKDFREIKAYDDVRGTRVTRTETRIELPPIRVPCQVEIIKFERLRQEFSGDMPDTNITLVLHRKTMRRRKLLDPYTGALLLHKNDRIESLEAYRNPKKTTQPLDPPGLYVFEIQPGSFGFGSDGFDLHIVYLNTKERAA